MFRAYGLLGILLIVFVEANFFFKVQPFANWYFPLVWFGYILVVDALVFKLKGNSLISNRFPRFLAMVIISVPLWWVFESVNFSVQNWSYLGWEAQGSSATILPAFFETVELIRSIHLFDKAKLRKRHKITKRFLHAMMGLGVACFLAPLLLPTFAFPLVWLGFFFLLDPVNYLHRQPSVIGHLKDRKLEIPLSLLLAGITLGLLWEFWNYWAIPKWTYDLPFIGFFKVFEMPILGYLGYFPFALELYAMYWFVRSLFLPKEHLLSE